MTVYVCVCDRARVMCGNGLMIAVDAGQTMAPVTTSQLMMHTVKAKAQFG